MTRDCLSRRLAIKLIEAWTVAAVVFWPGPATRASNSVVSYVIRVDRADLSGFDVQMLIPRARGRTRLAMASHPIYDDRYWRYVKDLSAESRGAKLSVTYEEDALWQVQAPGGELIVKYRVHLPAETSAIRSAYKPFLSETGGLVGDLHSLMYVVGATSDRARVTLDIPKTGPLHPASIRPATRKRSRPHPSSFCWTHRSPSANSNNGTSSSTAWPTELYICHNQTRRHSTRELLSPASKALQVRP